MASDILRSALRQQYADTTHLVTVTYLFIKVAGILKMVQCSCLFCGLNVSNNFPKNYGILHFVMELLPAAKPGQVLLNHLVLLNLVGTLFSLPPWPH